VAVTNTKKGMGLKIEDLTMTHEDECLIAVVVAVVLLTCLRRYEYGTTDCLDYGIG